MRVGKYYGVDRRSLATDVDRELDDALSTLWLVRGNDSAGNDFVSGFSPAVPRWAGTAASGQVQSGIDEKARS